MNMTKVVWIILVSAIVALALYSLGPDVQVALAWLWGVIKIAVTTAISLAVIVAVGWGIYYITQSKLLKKGKNQPTTEQKNEKEVRKTILTVSLVLIGVIGGAVYAILKWKVPEFELTEDLKFSVANFWALLVLAYIIFSFRFWKPVAYNERASLTLFGGRPLANVESGTPFAPLFVIQVITVTSEVIQKEFPADPENIYRGDMKSGDSLPEGMKPPIRVQFRTSITEAEADRLFNDAERNPSDVDGNIVPFVTDVPDDGLGRRVTAEPYPVVRFLINNPSLFLQNIGSVKNALEQIEDEMFSVLNRFYPRMSVGQALQNIRWMNLHLFNSVSKRVGSRGEYVRSWGIELQAAYVKYIYTSHGVNLAISEAAQAPFEKEKMIVTAEGNKRRIILEGEGYAKAAFELESKTLDGRARGLAKLAKELSISGQDAQAAEVGRAVADGGNAFILGDGGVTQIAAIAAAYSKKTSDEKEKGES